MTTDQPISFAAPDLLMQLSAMDDGALDTLDFGVLGFSSEPDACVLRYNAFEARGSGLHPKQVLGLPLFSVVAQCMNNYMVAQQFEDALAQAKPLDVTLPFVFTLRMRPTPVVLRLLAAPGVPMRFVAVLRTP